LGRRGEYGTIQVREGVLEGQLDGSEVIVRLGDTIGTQGIRRVQLVDVIGCFERHLYLHLHDVVEGVVRIPDIYGSTPPGIPNGNVVGMVTGTLGNDVYVMGVGTCVLRGRLEASRGIPGTYAYVGTTIV
jgi:hypothetical protein